MNWENRAAEAIRNRTDASVLRERADVVVRYLMGRQSDDDPRFAQALEELHVDADTAKQRCREMFDIALFGGRLHPYQVLGIEVTSSETVVREQYKRLVQLYHPDRNDSFDTDLANDRLVRLREARDAMLDGRPELVTASRPDARQRSARNDASNRRRSGVRTESPQAGYSQYTPPESKRDFGYDTGPAERATRDESIRSGEPERSAKVRSSEGRSKQDVRFARKSGRSKSRKSPSRIRLFFQSLTARHRPNSTAVSAVMFALAGAGALVLYLQSSPFSQRDDAVAENAAVDQAAQTSANGVDMLAGYPAVKQLLEVFAGAYSTGNQQLLMQQFGPDAVVNQVQGIGEIEKLFSDQFANQPGARLQFVVSATGDMGDGLLLLEGDATRDSASGLAGERIKTARFRMRIGQQAGRLRILSLEHEGLVGSGN